RARMADYEGEVVPFERAAADKRLQPAMRLLGARDDHQTRRGAIQSMDYPGPVLFTSCRHVCEQTVHESAGRMSRRGMNDDSGRLVHHQQVLVFVGDSQ